MEKNRASPNTLLKWLSVKLATVDFVEFFEKKFYFQAYSAIPQSNN